MINNIWTIEPAGDPGSAQALHSMGVSSATLTRRNQAAATLQMTIRTAEALTEDLPWAWESQWVLRRDGVIVFRGRVASLPRSGGREESATVEMRDAWWDLERTPYLQEWKSLTQDGVALVNTPRALLGRAASDRQTTIQAIEQILAVADAGGTTVDPDIQSLPTLVLPEIEATGQSCGDLLRAVLRWHPGATACIESDEEGDRLMVADRLMGDATTLTIGAPPIVEPLELVERRDLVCDSVHVHYETDAPQYLSRETDDGETSLRVRRSLLAWADVYPPESPVTRRSMVVLLPGPPQPYGAANAINATPPQPHRNPIKTRVLPPSGSNDSTAERWWLDHLGLTALGIDQDDIVLPPPGSTAAQPHRVRFAWEVDDPDDPLQAAPSAVNPESTPLWRPDSVDDLPRELVSGHLAEWMNVRAAEVVVDATVGIRKSTIDNLPANEWKLFQRLDPIEGVVGGVPAYLVHREVRVIGTDARTKVYVSWAGIGLGSADSQAGAVEEIMEENRIPDLAERLYDERSTAPWEGTINLLEAEAGGTRWIGRAINLAGGRSEWATMRALVQGETLNLETGATRLEIGPPQHLTHQDHRELYLAARRVREERAVSTSLSPPPALFPDDPIDDEDELPGTGGVYPPTVTPMSRSSVGGGAPPRAWDIIDSMSEGGDRFRLWEPTVYRTRADAEEVIPIIDSGFDPVEDSWLVAEITSLNPTSIEIKMLDTWPGYPSAYEFSGTGFAFAAARIPLWRFQSSYSTGAVALLDGVWGVKLITSDRLKYVVTLARVPGQAVLRSVPDLR